MAKYFVGSDNSSQPESQYVMKENPARETVKDHCPLDQKNDFMDRHHRPHIDKGRGRGRGQRMQFGDNDGSYQGGGGVVSGPRQRNRAHRKGNVSGYSGSCKDQRPPDANACEITGTCKAIAEDTKSSCKNSDRFYLGNQRTPASSNKTEFSQNTNNRAQSSREKTYSGKQERRTSGRHEQNPDVTLSKRLTYILRHGAVKEGFKLMEGGYLYVDELLKHNNLCMFDASDVERVVKQNSKQRLHLKGDENGRQMIRANQGHSLELEKLELTEITSAEPFPVVVHGTYTRCWDEIKEKGLSKMRRNHIHMACGVPGEDDIISGMRDSCDVIIYIDLKSALEDGLKFFLSENKVILTEGNQDGYLPVKYFSKVLRRRTDESLLPASSSST